MQEHRGGPIVSAADQDLLGPPRLQDIPLGLGAATRADPGVRGPERRRTEREPALTGRLPFVSGSLGGPLTRTYGPVYLKM